MCHIFCVVALPVCAVVDRRAGPCTCAPALVDVSKDKAEIITSGKHFEFLSKAQAGQVSSDARTSLLVDLRHDVLAQR
jgi:hypothetical protein